MADEEHSYALGELDRRLANILRHGTITEVDYANALAKVDLGDMITDWVPWHTPRAGQDQVWNTPDVGEQVTIFSQGDPSQGVIIGSLFQTAHPANGNAGKDRRITFKDGTVVEFDRDGSVLKITVNSAGNVDVIVGGTELKLQNGQATITSPAIVLNGPTTINGSLQVNGGADGVTMSGPFALTGASMTHNGKNVGSTHTHIGVTAGPSTTGVPS